MTTLAPYIIKSTSILVILLVYYKLFLRKQTFFRLNRLYLLGSLLIAVITPFISIEISSPAISASQPLKIYMSNLLDEVYVFGNYTSPQIDTTENHIHILLWTYWAGVLFFVSRYLWGIAQINLFIRRCPHKHYRGITITVLPEKQLSFSFFNKLFICSDLTGDDRRKIFEHEKIHIRQGHSLDLLITEIICISNWFNPFVWIFKNAIIENHEYIADQQVIRRFHIGSYLELLIRQTFKSTFSFTNYVSCSNLKKRTIMMTKKQSRKYWAISFIPVTAIIVTLSYGFSCNKTTEQTTILLMPKIVQPESTPVQPEDSTLFVVVEEMPNFSEGNVQQWIGQNVKYPIKAAEQNIQGKVYVQFIIEKDGSVTMPKIVRGADPLLDNEALRVIQSMPKWTPGKQRGKTVRVSYTLPINFALASSNSNNKPMSPDQYYDNYIKYLEAAAAKLKDPSLLNKWDKEPVGGVTFAGKNEETAYSEYLKQTRESLEAYIQELTQTMDKLNFSADEKKDVIKIYQTSGREMEKLIKSLGPKDFIKNFSSLTHFEHTKGNVETMLALKNNLSPERHKQLILVKYQDRLSNQGKATTVDGETVFAVVERLPEFKEGEIQKWLVQHTKYPAEAAEKKIQGKVYVQFIIEKDGSISNAKIVKSIDPLLDQEALRVIQSMPKWKPGTQRGQVVRVSYTLPINFAIPNTEK